MPSTLSRKILICIGAPLRPRAIGGFPSTARRRIAGIELLVISVVSFLLYATGVLALHQDRNNNWSVESYDVIPGAISHVVYGTPLGAVDANVRLVLEEQKSLGLVRAVAKVADGSVAPGKLELFSTDGIGVGSILFATVAMSLFGAQISSLIFFFLAVIGISVLAFTWRFQDARFLMIPLYFLVLSIIFLTPIYATSIVADQIPIGGNRYFTIAAILPALHIYFDIADQDRARSKKILFLDSILLTIQALILFGVLLVRSSASLLVGVIVAIFLFRLYAERKDWSKWAPVTVKFGLVVASAVFWGIVIAETMPTYVQAGRVLGLFWHRAFVSLSSHPEWPFGNLREVYDCSREFSEGLTRKNGDRNGHCIWWVYPPNRTRSDREVIDGDYGSEYERALRQAFFDVVRSYPKQVFEVFFYKKSSLWMQTLGESFQLQFSAAPKTVLGIVGIQFLIFISFIAASARRGMSVVNRDVLIIFVFFVLSLVPLYVAWSNLSTSVDTIFFMYCSVAIVIAFLVQAATEFIWAPSQK